jgi:hypothetical protein
VTDQERCASPPAAAKVGPAAVANSFWSDFVGLFALVFLAFGLGAVLSWSSFGSAVGPAFFYPPAGVSVAAMLLTRRALWPAVVAAIMAGEILVARFLDLHRGRVRSGSPPGRAATQETSAGAR